MTLTYDEIIEAMAEAIYEEQRMDHDGGPWSFLPENNYEKARIRTDARAALSALRALAEERGYRLMVPVCPTMAMELEWGEASHPHTATRDWAAMLSAAPDPTKGRSRMTDTPSGTHPYADRIAALEARVKSLEAWIDLLRQMGVAPSPPRGCVCPVGAEAVCRAAMCPRRPWVVT